MGKIVKRLGDVADYFDKEKLTVRCQLEYVGFAIESEIEQLKKDMLNVYGALAQRTKRIETLEEQVKHTEDKLDLVLKEHLRPLEIKEPVPTDKDRPFQVGDTIALIHDDSLRIVLKVNPNNTMKLMNVPSGYIQENCLPNQYTLVYRPGSPKPEPTIKEKIVTDKFGKPEGGLEQGDVLEYHSPRYQKHVDAIFTGQTFEQRCSGWIEACRVCDGEVVVIDIELDECKFKFRPRFPDRKER